MKSVCEITTNDEEARAKLKNYLTDRNTYDTEMANSNGTLFFEIPEKDVELLRGLVGRRAFKVHRVPGGRVLAPKLNQHWADFSHKAELCATLRRGVLTRGVGRQRILPFS